MRVSAVIGLILASALGTTLWYSCGPTQPAGPDRTTTTAADLLNQIIERNHGERRGTFGKSILEFRASPTANPTVCSIQSPDRFRIDHPGDGGHFTIHGEDKWQRKGARSADIPTDRLSETEQVQSLIRGLLLLPLYGPRDVAHKSNGQLQLHTQNGEAWTLDYDPETLAVTELSCAKGTITIHERHDNGTSFMPIRVSLGPLQDQLARIRATDVQFEDATFKRPEERSPTRRQISFQSTDHPLHPEFQWIEACQLLHLDVSADWDEIQKQARSAGMRLYKAGQKNAGDPYFVVRKDKRQLVIQFKPQENHLPEEFSPGPNELVESAPRRSAAVVYAATGASYAERVKASTDILESFLKAKGLHASGPVRIVVNSVFNDIGIAAERRTMDIRLELPIEH